MLNRVQESKDIKLKYTDKVVEFVAQSAYDSQFGARPIKRFIQSNIESVLAYKIIDGDMTSQNEYSIDVFAGKFIIK